MSRWPAALIVLCLVSGSARLGAAQNCGGFWPYGYGYGYGGYNLYGGEHIPYFALYPPVYYSFPVPRTYGWSPFAYPPGTMTPEVVEEEVVHPSKVMVNPYVPGEESGPPAEHSTSRSLRIENPFVTVEREERLARQPGH